MSHILQPFMFLFYLIHLLTSLHVMHYSCLQLILVLILFSVMCTIKFELISGYPKEMSQILV